MKIIKILLKYLLINLVITQSSDYILLAKGIDIDKIGELLSKEPVVDKDLIKSNPFLVIQGVTLTRSDAGGLSSKLLKRYKIINHKGRLVRVWKQLYNGSFSETIEKTINEDEYLNLLKPLKEYIDLMGIPPIPVENDINLDFLIIQIENFKKNKQIK
ncbi:MAG: hypothetical protein NZM04_02435 [Methylacidiphilales bacterium]|nr:hypothetical protein [Candidatus Methylacidiphilales bacterium]